MTARVLVARLDSDGDVLLAGPALRAVAASGAKVTLLCSSRGAQAAHLLPGIDAIEVFDAPWILADAPPIRRLEIIGLIDDLAALAIDQALILTSFHQSALPLALILRLAGVRTVAANSVDYPGSLLDVRNLPADDLHEVERNLSVAGRLGFELAPDDDGRLAVKDDAPNPLSPDGRDYVVVHPGARAPARAWTPEANTGAVHALARVGWRVVVTGGPAERQLGAVVSDAGRVAENLAGETDLPQLAAILRDAAAVVVGNTGPAHLAAAVGTPVVSLFAPTVPAVRWRPWMVANVILGQQDIGCAGCRATVCPIPGHPCISHVTAADVVQAVASVARIPTAAS
ncbi:MAG TPA: glycosyltransferase family 9 protein [Acidimicrobiales bacterium]|jgi:ADP-heptose:LPS heptosyltransferase